MYIKIARNGGYNEVDPAHEDPENPGAVMLWEVDNIMRYEIFKYASRTAYTKWLNKITEAVNIVEYPFEDPFDKDRSSGLVTEVISIRTEINGVSRIIIASECNVYIMNDDGKTIEQRRLSSWLPTKAQADR